MHPIIPLIWIIVLSTVIALLSASHGDRTLSDVMAELDLHSPPPAPHPAYNQNRAKSTR